VREASEQYSVCERGIFRTVLYGCERHQNSAVWVREYQNSTVWVREASEQCSVGEGGTRTVQCG
jgi:hypothetical protein